MSKYSKVISIRLTLEELKNLESIEKKIGKNRADLFKERILYQEQSLHKIFINGVKEILTTLYEIRDLIKIGTDYWLLQLFEEIELTQESKNDILTYRKGDIIKTDKNNLLAIKKINIDENLIEFILLPILTTSQKLIVDIKKEVDNQKMEQLFRKVEKE